MSEGLKYDEGKLPMHLLDRTALEAVASVLGHGRDKYGAENWREGIQYTRLIGAAMRHLHAVNDCEDIDQESGLLHAAHAMTSLMFLIWMMRYRPDLDDRWRGAVLVPKAEVQIEDDIAALAKKFAPIPTEAPDVER